jgi:sugar/nucleoside kinase (ribokinase family)
VRLARYPEPDEKVPAEELRELGGGPVPNALVTLARLGRRGALLGVVGDDAGGRLVRHELEAEGVDCSPLELRAGFATPSSVILVHGSRRAVCEHGQADLPLGPEALAGVTLPPGAPLLVDGRLPALQQAAARRARAAGGLVMLDAGRRRPGLDELLGLVDVAIVSHSFPRREGVPPARFEAFVNELRERLPRDGRRIAGVTLGAEGCLVAWEARAPVHVPALPGPVVDTTGAGDVFHGACLDELLASGDPLRAARFANAAAGLKCRGFTGRAPLPTRAEIAALAASR